MPEHPSAWPDKEYLEEVADQVADLFPTESAAGEWLGGQIARCVQQQEAHDRAVQQREQALAEHYRLIRRRRRLRKRKAGPPKQHPDWKYTTWLPAAPDDTVDERVLGDEDSGVAGWGPRELLDERSIPSEPIRRLDPFGDPEKPKEEVLPAHCFILAAVHDIARRGKGFSLLLDGCRLPLALQACLDFQTGDDGGMQMAGFERDTIGTALQAVRKELRELALPPTGAQPGTGDPAQEPKPETDWRDVQARLLRLYDAGEPYTSQDDLAKRLGCARATVNKAINDDSPEGRKLKGWMARYRKTALRAQSLTDVVLESVPSDRESDPADAVPDDEVDRTMHKLVEQAKTPEERAKLNALNYEQRREMVGLVLEQKAAQHIEDEAPGGNRLLGRKP